MELTFSPKMSNLGLSPGKLVTCFFHRWQLSFKWSLITDYWSPGFPQMTIIFQLITFCGKRFAPASMRSFAVAVELACTASVRGVPITYSLLPYRDHLVGQLNRGAWIGHTFPQHPKCKEDLENIQAAKEDHQRVLHAPAILSPHLHAPPWEWS